MRASSRFNASDGAQETILASEASKAQAAAWLLENGPKQLELLFRAIVYHPSVPILIVDNERNYRDASAGAGKLLGLSRNRVIGQKIDDFADPTFRPQISELWRAFLSHGEQEGALRLAGPDGTPRDGVHGKGGCLAGATPPGPAR